MLVGFYSFFTLLLLNVLPPFVFCEVPEYALCREGVYCNDNYIVAPNTTDPSATPLTVDECAELCSVAPFTGFTLYDDGSLWACWCNIQCEDTIKFHDLASYTFSVRI
jgi:hypothetical protein